MKNEMRIKKEFEDFAKTVTIPLIPVRSIQYQSFALRGRPPPLERLHSGA